MTCVNYLLSGKVYSENPLQDGAILMADDGKQSLDDVTGDDIRRVRECEEAARERFELEKQRAAEAIEEARRRARAIEASADQRISRYQESCERKLERRMRERYPATSDPTRGGRLRLRPGFAEVLDRYCAIDCEDRPSGQDVLAAGRDGMVEPADWQRLDIDAVLAQMRRWQVQEDLRWSAMSAVSRAVGRGPLLRGAFEDPSPWV